MSDEMLYQKPLLVPEICDDDIYAMLAVMRPAAQINFNTYREIDISQIHLRRTAFTWEPKLIGKTFAPRPLSSTILPSFHGFAAPVFFKPSIAEALASIRRFCPDWSTIRFFALYDPVCWGSSSCHLAKCMVTSEPLFLDEHQG